MGGSIPGLSGIGNILSGIGSVTGGGSGGGGGAAGGTNPNNPNQPNQQQYNFLTDPAVLAQFSMDQGQNPRNVEPPIPPQPTFAQTNDPGSWPMPPNYRAQTPQQQPQQPPTPQWQPTGPWQSPQQPQGPYGQYPGVQPTSTGLPEETQPPPAPSGGPPDYGGKVAATPSGLPEDVANPPRTAPVGTSATTPPDTTTAPAATGGGGNIAKTGADVARRIGRATAGTQQPSYYPDIAGSARESGAGAPSAFTPQAGGQAINPLQAISNFLNQAFGGGLQGMTQQAGPAYGTNPPPTPPQAQATPSAPANAPATAAAQAADAMAPGSAAAAVVAGARGAQTPGQAGQAHPPLVLRDPSDPSKGYMPDPSANPGGTLKPDGSGAPTNGMPGGTTANAPPATVGYGAFSDQGRRPPKYSGKITTPDGKQYDYVTGGGQFPSLPYGKYYVHPGAIGSVGKSIGAWAGISDSNNPTNNTVNDPLYRGAGGTHARDGVEIHPDVSGARQVTNGCIGINRYEASAFGQSFAAAAATKRPMVLTVNPGGNATLSYADEATSVTATGQQAATGTVGQGVIPGSQQPAGTRPADVNYQPRDYQRALFQIEGGGNINAPRTGSNRGIAQFGREEERRFGITNRRDINQEARGVQREATENTQHLEQAGVPADPANLYLLHQQGQAGGTALLQADANTPAYQVLRRFYGSDALAQRAIHGNIPSNNPLRNVPADQVTAGQFRDMWRTRFNEQMGNQSQAEGGTQLAGDVVPYSRPQNYPVIRPSPYDVLSPEQRLQYPNFGVPSGGLDIRPWIPKPANQAQTQMPIRLAGEIDPSIARMIEKATNQERAKQGPAGYYGGGPPPSFEESLRHRARENWENPERMPGGAYLKNLESKPIQAYRKSKALLNWINQNKQWLNKDVGYWDAP